MVSDFMQLETIQLIDIRFHGRAGQGVVTASRILGEAAMRQNKWIHAFPNFGPERMGAPVTAFTRISDKKFTVKTQIDKPDFIVIIEPSLVSDEQYYNGLKEGGTVVLNTTQIPPNLATQFKQKGIKVFIVDGDSISRKYLGRTIANTVMLGSLIKATGIVQIEHLIDVMKEKFSGKVAEDNAAAIYAAYEEVKEI